MKQIIFKHINTYVGFAVIAFFSSIFGAIFLREALSFAGPGSAPATGTALSQDTGFIGDPVSGITGAPTLFEGQAAIKAAVDAIGGGGGGGIVTVVNPTNLGGRKADPVN